MSRQISSDFFGVLKGIQMISNECLRIQEKQLGRIWTNSSLKNSLVTHNNFLTSTNHLLASSNLDLENLKKETLQRSSMVVIGIKVFASEIQDIRKQNSYVNDFDIHSTTMNLDPIKVENIKSVNVDKQSKTEQSDNIKLKQNQQTSDKTLVKKIEMNKSDKNEESKNVVDQGKLDKRTQTLNEAAKPTRVPSTRFGRMMSFGSLAAGLGIGTVAEMTRRTLGLQQTTNMENPFLTPANAERIVNTLCKVRGAALKIGQILSIQDNNVISPTLQQAFERVRQSADFMPDYQVQEVLREELGDTWRSKFIEFDMKPFAAASIGQVHYGKTAENGLEVAVKIQYPGVAKGIHSDIENLVSVMNLWNIFPEGMFIDKLVEVAKKELAWEVDYIREAECTKMFKKLLSPFDEYFVPAVVDQLSTRQVFTTELVHGQPVDQCANLDEKSRHHICQLIMKLCLYELFTFRYMQTDPNWSNFFYNTKTKQIILLDFGATRSYEKTFMDKYIKVIKAAADGDRQQVLDLSMDMGFLTGYESKAMKEAHVDTVMILGEVFSNKTAEFDFSRQDTTLRVTKLVPTILSHRLCPPPEEIYSLHRKLSGVFLLCAKLGVKLDCRQMFLKIYNDYVFD